MLHLRERLEATRANVEERQSASGGVGFEPMSDLDRAAYGDGERSLMLVRCHGARGGVRRFCMEPPGPWALNPGGGGA